MSMSIIRLAVSSSSMTLDRESWKRGVTEVIRLSKT